MHALAVVLLLVLLCTALGRRLLRLCRVRFESLLEESCFAAGLGMGALALIVMTAGLLGRLDRDAVWIGLLLAGCLLAPDAAMLGADMLRRLRRIRLPGRNVLGWILLAALAAAVLLGTVAALAPPTAWDATTTHLKLPLRFLRAGGIHRVHDLHSYGPLNGVMLFLPAMALGGDTAPALLHLACMVLTGLTLVSVARRHLSPTGTLVVAAAYVLMPIHAALASEAVVDLVLVFFTALAFAAFLRWWERERAGWAVLAALFLGLAVGTKYTALFGLLLLAVGALVKAAGAKRRRARLLSHGAAALLIAAAVGCPWYVRNAVLTGNPFYPVLAETIPTRDISVANTGRVRPVTGKPVYPRDALNLLLYPVNQTLGFGQGIAAGPAPESATESPGPLFLALLPLVLLLRPVPVWARLAVGLALGAMVLIVPVSPLPRYVLPFVTPCALVVGWAFDRLAGRRGVRRALAVVLTVVFALQLVPFAARAAARARVAVGLETREAYLRRVDDVYPVARQARSLLPAGARILYVGLRVYHLLDLSLDADMGMPRRQAVVDFPSFATPADLHRRLRTRGYDYLLVNEAVLTARAPLALRMLDALEGDGLEVVETLGRHPDAPGRRFVIYRVAPRSSPGADATPPPAAPPEARPPTSR
jgi:hypothetical protein